MPPQRGGRRQKGQGRSKRGRGDTGFAKRPSVKSSHTGAKKYGLGGNLHGTAPTDDKPPSAKFTEPSPLYPRPVDFLREALESYYTTPSAAPTRLTDEQCQRPTQAAAPEEGVPGWYKEKGV